jgi:hypothetical protein
MPFAKNSKLTFSLFAQKAAFGKKITNFLRHFYMLETWKQSFLYAQVVIETNM